MFAHGVRRRDRVKVRVGEGRQPRELTNPPVDRGEVGRPEAGFSRRRLHAPLHVRERLDQRAYLHPTIPHRVRRVGVGARQEVIVHALDLPLVHLATATIRVVGVDEPGRRRRIWVVTFWVNFEGGGWRVEAGG